MNTLGFIWLETDTWIVITGICCALACAIPGALLVLRGMSMMGDAISHTVLPGLAIAFIITNSREPLPMFIGAVVVGILTAVLVQWIGELGKTDGGTSMGVVFTTLFALGLVLLRQVADKVDLDAGCVLYGAVETAAADKILVMGFEWARPAVICGSMFIVNTILLLLFYKEYKISSFDPALATTLGFNAKLMHYLLMIMTAATTVAAFETVGSILVIAMLIVPAAAAQLLTDRFALMFLLTAILGALSAVLGHLSAITVPTWFGYGDTVTSGMMATAAGAVFVVVWLIAPRHGMISRIAHRAVLAVRVAREDMLGLLYRLEEMPPEVQPVNAQRALKEAIASPRWIRNLAMRRMRRDGSLTPGSTLMLSDSGRSEARRLVRTHRLWEAYLHKFLGLPADHLHDTAERLEHLTDAQMADTLAQRTDQPDTDPQGRAIPPQ